jgi:hypothetical protein
VGIEPLDDFAHGTLGRMSKHGDPGYERRKRRRERSRAIDRDLSR